jgi:hypothetical protein
VRRQCSPVRRHPGPRALDQGIHDIEVEGVSQCSGRWRFRRYIGAEDWDVHDIMFEISSVDRMCPPAEHLIRTFDLLSGQLMQYGLLDLFKVLGSDGSGKPVYNWWCGFRKIQVCSFISSLGSCIIFYCE